jgi:hypothetical protein
MSPMSQSPGPETRSPSLMELGSLTQPPTLPPTRVSPSAGPPSSLNILHKLISRVRHAFKYPKLGPGEDFRLLVVQPGIPSDPVKCKIVAASFAPTSPYKYEALSYTWGNEAPTQPISIISFHRAPGERFSLSNVSSAPLYIGPNLHAAICALRRPESDIILWIDTICIDQLNSQERQSQVPIIPRIFHHAANVCVWLGPENDAHDAAGVFGLIRAMLDLAALERLLVDPQKRGHWTALINLMKNRWFSRRWVLQEISWARNATVHYGVEKIDWADFSTAVDLFKVKEDRVTALLLPTTARMEATPLANLEPVFTLIPTTRHLFRKTSDGKVINKLLSLETLVSSFRDFMTTDPRDVIYALLSIAKDSPLGRCGVSTPEDWDHGASIDSRIAPDYTKSFNDVYIGFIDYCVETSKSLDILCKHWIIHRQLEELPSWIPDVTTSPFGDPTQMMTGRLNGDDFVAAADSWPSLRYKTSAGLLPHCTFGKSDLPFSYGAQGGSVESGELNTPGSGMEEQTLPRNSSTRQHTRYDGSLIVKGIKVDEVDELSQRLVQGAIFQEALEIGGWPLKNRPDRVPDELWRTLVADRGPNGVEAPSWYALAFEQSLSMVTPSGDLQVGSLLSGSMPSLVVDFLKRVQAVAWNRKIIRTKGDGYGGRLLGLAPAQTKSRDIVAILFGCSVPVILRKRAGDGGDYEFIGAAYIHGIMDGEALAGKQYNPPYENAVEFRIT